MKIYLVGPISGKGYDEVVDRYKIKTKKLEEMGYKTLCPMAGKNYLRNELEFKAHGFTNPVSTNKAITNRDRWMVTQADILLCDFSNSGNRVSIGSVCEISWANLLGKHVITIIPENNVHRHAFILQQSDIIFSSLDEAYKYLNDFILGIKAI